MGEILTRPSAAAVPQGKAAKAVSAAAARAGLDVGVGGYGFPQGPRNRARVAEAARLHGAMVAHGCDDCEGDLLARARALAGADCVIAAEMDPHCHLSPLRMEMADLLVCFKEYSHIDFVERADIPMMFEQYVRMAPSERLRLGMKRREAFAKRFDAVRIFERAGIGSLLRVSSS